MTAGLRFEDVSVGDEIPSRAIVVRREQVKAYADASGDQNALHQDDGFARAAGFPGVIAHGMFAMGFLTTCLTDWLGGSTGLKRMKAGFRAAAFMGDEIVAGGRVRAKDPATRRATLEIWVTVNRDGVTEYPVRRGEAEVELA